MPYCKYCGKELKPGEVCNCTQSKMALGENVAQQNGSTRKNESDLPTQLTKTWNSQTTTGQTSGTGDFDFNKQLEFFKLYFKTPEKACSAYSSREFLPLSCSLAVLFLIFSGLSQLPIGIKIEALQGNFFGFGILFGIVLLVVPILLNMLTLQLQNKTLDFEKLACRTFLHSTMVSIMLFLTFLLGLASLKSLPWMYGFTFIVYAISLAPELKEALPSHDTFGKKVAAFFLVSVTVLLFVLTLYVETRSMVSAASGSMFGFFDFSDILGELI